MLGNLSKEYNTKEIESLHECNFCNAIYKTERGVRHHLDKLCVVKKKYGLMLSPIGRNAWIYYQYWLYKKYNTSEIEVKTFIESKSFNPMVKFTEYVSKIQHYSPYHYMDFVIRKNYPPVMWYNDEIYNRYLIYLDNDVSPIDRIDLMVKILTKLARVHDYEFNGIFSNLSPCMIINQIRNHSFTPWLLLKCSSFLDIYNNCNGYERHILDLAISSKKWITLFDDPKNKKILQYVQKVKRDYDIS